MKIKSRVPKLIMWCNSDTMSMWKYTNLSLANTHKMFQMVASLTVYLNKIHLLKILRYFSSFVLLYSVLVNENTQLVLQLYLGFLSRIFYFLIELPYCMLKRRYYHASISIAACFAYTTDILNIWILRVNLNNQSIANNGNNIRHQTVPKSSIVW